MSLVVAALVLGLFVDNGLTQIANAVRFLAASRAGTGT